jgi:3-dehydroquinate synthase
LAFYFLLLTFMHRVRVGLAARSYDIAITEGDIAGLGPFARERRAGIAALVMADEQVPEIARGVAAALDAVGFRAQIALVPSGETQKSLAGASSLYDRLAGMDADRQTLVVAVGGGVVGDLAGFVASTYARGLPLLMVPTTLLAMVDSSVGGKVGINHPKGKNLIGAFHQPVGVWIDIATLATLPDRAFRSGLAEVVKYGVALDAELFVYLEGQADAILQRESVTIQHIVARSCELKARIVEQDEREETGTRAVLNYGHTFAHAFESVSDYSGWLHGEAVAAGMACAARLAQRRGLVPADFAYRQSQLLTRFGLPTVPEAWPVPELIAAMRRDKKNVGGRLRLVLPRRLGQAALFDDVSEAEVIDVLKEMIDTPTVSPP